jgi:hypothetical protein
VTESQATRQNAKGDPCPPWCVTDHSLVRYGQTWGYHSSEDRIIHTPSGYANATAYQNGSGDDEPRVCLTCLHGPVGVVLVDVADAGKLAALVEDLADATPEQHRELADAIRQAAAVITDGGQP